MKPTLSKYAQKRFSWIVLGLAEQIAVSTDLDRIRFHQAQADGLPDFAQDHVNEAARQRIEELKIGAPAGSWTPQNAQNHEQP